jgi:predicted enzyme related to lactoylglutathione lyase
MTGRVVHFEIPFDDGERARSFYKDVFGWQLMDVPELSYTLVTTGPSGDQGPTEPGFIGGGMTQRGGPNTAPTVVIDVEDIDAALAEIEQHGGRRLVERQPVGEMGWSAYFADPEGNTVGLWQSA